MSQIISAGIFIPAAWNKFRAGIHSAQVLLTEGQSFKPANGFVPFNLHPYYLSDTVDYVEITFRKWHFYKHPSCLHVATNNASILSIENANC